MNPLVVVSATPTCPPPVPPAPLLPPAFALTGTGPVVSISALPEPEFGGAFDPEPVVALRVVPPARYRAAKAPFIALVLGLLGGGLVSLLLINTALSQGAFALQKLQKTNIGLTEQQQQISKALADADQPAALASKAVALGMVPGGAPAFLRLPDGKVLGSPKVAVPLPKPTPSATTTPGTTTPGTTTPGTLPSPGTVTSAPVTSAPVTSAPVTSAPVTSAPATSAPVTSAVVTSPAGSPPPAAHTTPAGQGKSTTKGKQAPPTKGKP